MPLWDRNRNSQVWWIFYLQWIDRNELISCGVPLIEQMLCEILVFNVIWNWIQIINTSTLSWWCALNVQESRNFSVKSSDFSMIIVRFWELWCEQKVWMKNLHKKEIKKWNWLFPENCLLLPLKSTTDDIPSLNKTTLSKSIQWRMHWSHSNETAQCTCRLDKKSFHVQSSWAPEFVHRIK